MGLVLNLQPTRKQESWSDNCKELNSANNLNQLEDDSAPEKPLERDAACQHLEFSPIRLIYIVMRSKICVILNH